MTEEIYLTVYPSYAIQVPVRHYNYIFKTGDGKNTGYAEIDIEPPGAIINYMMVRDEFQKKGYATKQAKLIERELRRRRIHMVGLVASGRAAKIWQHLGYKFATRAERKEIARTHRGADWSRYEYVKRLQ